MSIEKTVKKTPQQQQQQSRPGGPGGRPGQQGRPGGPGGRGGRQGDRPRRPRREPVVEGYLKDRNFFLATKILAKHDENYMPPEVKEALEGK